MNVDPGFEPANFKTQAKTALTNCQYQLLPRTPDPEVGGSSPTLVKPCCVLEQGTFTPQKVLVISRKWWLRLNMTEKLFTGTLRINQPTNQYQLRLQDQLDTLMTLSFRTDRSGQTVQTQIRLLRCLLFHLHHFDKIPIRFGLFV